MEFSVQLSDLAPWSETLTQETSGSDKVREGTFERSKFPYDRSLNDRIYLWQGRISSLEVDAVVCSTNEPLTDHSGVCGEIIAKAGSGLLAELESVKYCRTGEAKIISGHELPASYVILTVGPRFNRKYETAAENALHGCYRNCLRVLKENNLRSIAFCVINSERRGYPREEASHVAIRTVRRFLEHFGQGISHVVFCMPKVEDTAIYERTLPLYFPRSVEEENRAVNLLPENTGNELGETEFAERKIRISPFPGMKTADDDGCSDSDDSEVEQEVPAARMLTELQCSPDSNVTRAVSKESEGARLFKKYIDRAVSIDLSDIDSMKIISSPGKDKMGRDVILILACQFPRDASDLILDKILAYMLNVMEPHASARHIIIYIHGGMDDDQVPPLSWLSKVHKIWDFRYSRTLEKLYVVHPTFWLRLFYTALRPFISSKFYESLQNLSELSELYNVVDPTKIPIPSKVFQFDEKISGHSWDVDESSSFLHNQL